MAFIRKSKFRHVFGKPLKRDQGYDGLRISRVSWDSTFCVVNPKFVAVMTDSAGGGAFLVLPLSKVGRLDVEHPLVAGHRCPILDISWCPHNDNFIASASEDCTVKVWEIPDDGLKESLTEPIIDLQGHQKRATLVVWHPTAYSILLSTGSDFQTFIWNLQTGEAIMSVSLPDQLYSVSFNEDGSRFSCTCKDKNLRVIDSHTGGIISEGKCHMGSKPAQCAYLKNGQIFTSGFSRMSARQYGLWNENDLSASLTQEDVDNSNGVLFVFYDPDTSLIYLAGKGDGQIRYYEVTDEEPYVHFLTLYSTNSPQKGVGFMPKRGLNVNSNEIARFYKLHNNGFCEVIPFTVPRKSELFQDDLYPDTASDTPALTAEEFESGKNAKPILVSLKDGYTPSTKKGVNFMKKSALDKAPPKQAQSAAPSNGSEAASPALPPVRSGIDLENLMKEVQELKKTVSQQDARIAELEKKLSEKDAGTDEEEA